MSDTATPTNSRKKRDLLKMRARLAILTRHHGASSDQAKQAAAELRAAVLEEHIRRAVSGEPPLTATERDRLALILRGSM
jgi:hypothetical protein